MAGTQGGPQWQGDCCAVLTQKQVAEWLQVQPRQLKQLGVPCLDLGHKTKRYVVKDVLAWLDSQRQTASRGRSDGEG